MHRLATMKLCLYALLLSGTWGNINGFTCTPRSMCSCSYSGARCDVGYRDSTFPVITGQYGQLVEIYGNKNMTSFPNGTFLFTAYHLYTLKISGTSITEFSCTTFQRINRLTSVYFTNNALTTIPSCALRGPLRYGHVYLSSNAIENVHADDLISFTRIATLDLSSNIISNLDQNVFSNLTQLTKLDLGNNKLTTISNDLFPGSSRLIILNLQNNVISTIEHMAFRSLTRLNTLSLNGNRLDKVDPEWFLTLRNLHYLQLQGNKIGKVQSGEFKANCYLYSIDLSSNVLQTLPRLWLNTSCSSVGLYTLDLSNNNISQIEDKAFEELGRLYSLNLINNQLTILRREAFNGASNLHTLSLSGNQIYAIEQLAFQGLSQLSRLSLANNTLQELSSHNFRQMESLRTLRLNQNKLSRIDRSAFQGLELLTGLYLSDNNLKSESLEGLRDSLVHLSRLSTLILSGNPLTSLPNDVFEFVNLNHLNLSNCQLQTMPYESLHPLLELNTLDLSRNNFSKDSQTLSLLSKSYNLYVDVSGNQMKALNVSITSAQNNFKPTINASRNKLEEVTVVLKAKPYSTLKLYLADNKLSKPVVVQIVSNTRIFTLETLDLSRNSLSVPKRIPVDIQVIESEDSWKPCSSDKLGDVTVNIGTLTLDSNNIQELTKAMCLGYVNVLELNNNNIQTVLSSIFHHDKFLCKTTSLSLGGNKLKKLPVRTLKQLCSNLRIVNVQGNLIQDLNTLKSLTTVPTVTVQMSGNPLQCGCNILWLRSSSLINQITDSRCVSPDSSIGFKPYCFPDYTCFNKSANESSSTLRQCDSDRYVSMYRLSLTRTANYLKVDWAASGPGEIDHFEVSSFREGQITPLTALIPWDVYSTNLHDLALDEFRYKICVKALGSNVQSDSGVKCSEAGLVHNRNNTNVTQKPGKASSDKTLGLELGVSFGVGIPVVFIVVIGIVCYRRRTSSREADLKVKYISTDE